jgi:hypothetical protein
VQRALKWCSGGRDKGHTPDTGAEPRALAPAAQHPQATCFPQSPLAPLAASVQLMHSPNRELST